METLETHLSNFGKVPLAIFSIGTFPKHKRYTSNNSGSWCEWRYHHASSSTNCDHSRPSSTNVWHLRRHGPRS